MGSLPINVFSPLDPKTFSEESSHVVEFIANYYKNIETYPVLSQVEPGYLQKQCPNSAPHFPEPLETILEDIQTKILPGLTHWQSPNFFAYFQANASTAGFMGEMLTAGLNVVGFNWISSPAATELEMIVMNWIGNLLQLPQNFLFSNEFDSTSGGGGGVIHGSTCEAIVCTLAAARDRALMKHGENSITKLVVYTSDQTHFTVQKASKLVGIPPRNFRIIPTSSLNNYELSPGDLQNEIEKDLASGLIPLYMCITIGTTATSSVDPLKDLATVGKDYSIWVHVDAAYAGSACICPEFRHYLNGAELVDSISMNPHKWFLTNMECCCLWVQNSDLLIDSLSTNPDILQNNASKSKKVVDYKDWQIALSRRFRAMKMWVILRRYGALNLMNHIRSDIELAKYFEKLVLSDERFAIVVPRKFALVCFKLRAEGSDDEFELNYKLLEAVNCSGKAYMIHTVLDGNVFVIRCAIGVTLTEKCHIDQLWKLILDKTDSISSEKTNEPE